MGSMKSWRPDGWAHTRSVWFEEHFSDAGIRQKAYEAGADALLNVLKQKGKYIDASKYPYGLVLNQIPPIEELTRDFKGYLIIIPDEGVGE